MSSLIISSLSFQVLHGLSIISDSFVGFNIQEVMDLGKWSEEAKRRHFDGMKQTLTSLARVPSRGSSKCVSLV
jgi:hypothetical protein